MALVLSFVHPLWHAHKKQKTKKIETRTHACMAYIHRSMYIWTTAPFVFLFVWFKQRQQRQEQKRNPKKQNKKRNKANISSWMSCIGWTQSSHKALRGGSRIALPLTGPVVSSLQIIVPCLPERIWLGAQSPPLPFPSLRDPVLSQMFSHSCKGQWKRFLNLCQHTGEREEEIFIIYRSKVWLMFHE